MADAMNACLAWTAAIDIIEEFRSEAYFYYYRHDNYAKKSLSSVDYRKSLKMRQKDDRYMMAIHTW